MSPADTEIDWYDIPLYYDMVFEEDTRREGSFLEGLQVRWGRTRGRRAFEPACGSGRLLVEMDRRGYSVVGLDRNKNMLRFAEDRRRELGCAYRVREGLLERFELPGAFDLGFCLVSTFKYILTGPEARSHLECAASSLAPGGLYVIGLHLADYDSDSKSRERWVATRDGVTVTSNLQTWPANRETRRERVRVRLRIEEGDGSPRRLETNWEFRTYDAAELTRLLRSVPALEHVATHDFHYDLDREIPLDGQRLDVVVVLRKRERTRLRRVHRSPRASR